MIKAPPLPPVKRIVPALTLGRTLALSHTEPPEPPPPPLAPLPLAGVVPLPPAPPRTSMDPLALTTMVPVEAMTRTAPPPPPPPPPWVPTSTSTWRNGRWQHGPAASSILDAAHSLQPDLIIMATYGRSGAARWLLGSIAEMVLRHAGCPVALVNAPATEWGSPPHRLYDQCHSFTL